MAEIEKKSYIIAFIQTSQMSLGYGSPIYVISTQIATNSTLQISHRFLKRERLLAFFCFHLFNSTALSHFIEKPLTL